MRQKINFSSVFMKQLDSNEFKDESKIDFNNDENAVIIKQI